MCQNLLPKNIEPPKIDLSLKSILEQRLFYPVYPQNYEVPIEYEQIESLMMKDGENTPDILITPSDLVQFVKVLIFICNSCLEH